MPTDSLSGVVSTTTSITRTQSDTVGSQTAGISTVGTYSIGGASGPNETQLWVSNRSLSAGASETLNLLSLADSLLGATGNQVFRQVTCVRVSNQSTTTGLRVVVGPSGTNGWGRVAGDVGPGGEVLGVQKVHPWGVTAAECGVTIRATGPTGPVLFSIVVCGTNATGPTGY
jgi:hypothetical protein